MIQSRRSTLGTRCRPKTRSGQPGVVHAECVAMTMHAQRTRYGAARETTATDASHPEHAERTFQSAATSNTEAGTRQRRRYSAQGSS